MMSLNEVVKKYLANKQLVKETKITLTYSWGGSLSKAKYLYLSPLDFIETEKYYFFDRRKPYLKMNTASSFVSLFLLGGFAFLLWLSAWGQSLQSLFLVVAAFLVGFIPVLFNRLINEGLVNIVVLKKGWVRETAKDGEKIILRGTLPSGENYSFIYLLGKESQEELSFWDKLFSGLSIKRLSKFSPELKFEFSYKEA